MYSSDNCHIQISSKSTEAGGLLITDAGLSHTDTALPNQSDAVGILFLMEEMPRSFYINQQQEHRLVFFHPPPPLAFSVSPSQQNGKAEFCSKHDIGVVAANANSPRGGQSFGRETSGHW